MKVLPALLFAAAITNSGNAFACSYAVREHPILASHAPAAANDGRTTIRIAVSEALLPARFAKTQYPFARIWLGLRGQKLVGRTGEPSAELVEVIGKIDLVCFYPSDAYEVLPDGRLVVWISGKLETATSMKLLLANAPPSTESEGSVWRKVRWFQEETPASSPLPSNPQPGMIQP